MTPWSEFPHDCTGFDYRGAALRKHWPRLHRGDREPFPSTAALQEPWRAYHRGDFQRANERGLALGLSGYAAANKAAATYAGYLEIDGSRAGKLLAAAAERSDAAREAMPEHANSHFLVAYCLGRYAQRVSVAKALAEGAATRIRQALDRTIELEPRHAEAHVAAGTYHAVVIGAVGALLGRITYGASESEALAHYRKALALAPESPIARVEYAAGLLRLEPRKKAQARKLLTAATKLKPADAAERLDVELAATRLEELAP